MVFSSIKRVIFCKTLFYIRRVTITKLEMSNRQRLDPKVTTTSDDGDIGSKACGKILIALTWFAVIITAPISIFFCFKVVQEYERAVIFRIGRLLAGGAKGPGIFFILPFIDIYTQVDLRTRTYDVPPQEVLTKDSVTVSVDAVVYYRVFNPTMSIANVEDGHESTRLLAQTILRNTMGTRPLHEILSERETLSANMQEALDAATEEWGIKVERVEIKDVRLPAQLQKAMAAEAEAAREAKAKVIAAKGEQKAAQALREAAEVIADSPAALQLRYLQTLNTIAGEKNSTIVFPLPIDFLTHLMKAANRRVVARIKHKVVKSNKKEVAHHKHKSMKANKEEPSLRHKKKSINLILPSHFTMRTIRF